MESYVEGRKKFLEKSAKKTFYSFSEENWNALEVNKILILKYNKIK